MITHDFQYSDLSFLNEGSQTEMCLLINAALVDQRFCNLLLRDPSTALENGFYGRRFRLSARELQFVLTVKATSLTSFAAQWVSCNEGTMNCFVER